MVQSSPSYGSRKWSSEEVKSLIQCRGVGRWWDRHTKSGPWASKLLQFHYISCDTSEGVFQQDPIPPYARASCYSDSPLFCETPPLAIKLSPLHKHFLESWLFYRWIESCLGFPGGSDGKESACSAEDPGPIPESGRSPGEGHDNPLPSSCLENPMDRGVGWATVYGVTKSRTRLRD